MATNSIEQYIKLEDCVARRVYKISSRNLKHGIYDGKDGFIGIRTKFGNRFLFTEHHWDSPSFATVKPLEYTGIDLPENIPLVANLQPIDEKTRRPVYFDKVWRFVDTNEAEQNIRAVGVQNKEIFKFLEEVEKKEAIK